MFACRKESVFRAWSPIFNGDRTGDMKSRLSNAKDVQIVSISSIGSVPNIPTGQPPQGAPPKGAMPPSGSMPAGQAPSGATSGTKSSDTSSKSNDTNAKAADGDYLNWAPGRIKTASGHYHSTTESTASSSVNDMLTLIQAANKS